jgi:hypothetical protein
VKGNAFSQTRSKTFTQVFIKSGFFSAPTTTGDKYVRFSAFFQTFDPSPVSRIAISLNKVEKKCAINQKYEKNVLALR